MQRLSQRPLLPFVALLLGVLLLANGARMTIAGLADFQARAFLADWETAAAEPTPRAWQIAFHAAERAVAAYPGTNGDYLERLGHAHLWRHLRHPFGNPEAHDQRIAARNAYRAATQSRPTWPRAWAALAYAKLHLLEFDAEFHHALAEARRLGPWRADILHRLAEIGFIAWPQLDAGERTATLESARRSLSQKASGAAQLFPLAHAAGQRQALCQALGERSTTRFKRDCPPA